MVEDENGYKFKFIQCISAPIDPLSQIMLRVQDLNISTNFYSKVHDIYIIIYIHIYSKIKEFDFLKKFIILVREQVIYKK